MRASDVFKPQGVPVHTLVNEFYDLNHGLNIHDDRAKYPDKKQIFEDAIEEKGKLIRVIGPSKSGKTVFVKTLASGKEIVRVSASGLESSKDLWMKILAALGEGYVTQTSTESTNVYGGELTCEGGANLLVTSFNAEGTAKFERHNSSGKEYGHYNDPLSTLIKKVNNSNIWIFIDDFHYASQSVQFELSEQIKHAAEENVQIILALIPGRSEDILLKNDDLRGRTVDIKFTYWGKNDLKIIAERGFPLLGIQLDPGSSEFIAEEAAGSPQLMQSICLEIAKEFGARKSVINPARNFNLDAELLKRICFRLSESSFDYSETIEQMKKGPPTRGVPRKSYPDESGNHRDVYHLIVEALSLNPPKLKLTDTEVETRCAGLAGTRVASVWESVRHICDIVNSMSSEIKMDFGADHGWVAILDPYLFFALRWHGDEQ